MKKYLYTSTFAALFLVAFHLPKHLPFVVPQNWGKPAYNFQQNPLSEEKILLGRVLFYEPLLSLDSSISCANCHSQYSAFTHVDHELSHGIGDSIGNRNSPALMNLAWHKRFMWDGSIHHLDMQSLAPITHPKEMGEKMENVVVKLQKTKRYPPLFYQAFGDSTVTGEHLLKAISQFMLTLVSANAKYDKVMRKEAEFTEQEQRGYQLFLQHCNSCHTEPLFTNHEFANNGLPIDSTLNDWGRMNITQNPKDSLLFKIPTLRNIEFSYPYMHDGRFKKISEILKHYTTNIQPSKTLAPALQKPLALSANEKVDIIAFLLTLTDKEFLFNPAYSYPKAEFLK
ncbi:MAG: cytochrome-c peroxidase [Bacteroidia bacterium]